MLSTKKGLRRQKYSDKKAEKQACVDVSPYVIIRHPEGKENAHAGIFFNSSVRKFCLSPVS
jgi:hypothetical protein